MRTHGKKHKKLIRAGKATAFWYVSVITASTLVAPTFAHFSSSQQINGTIKAGTWPVPWAQTDVKLTVDKEEIESCEPINVKAKLTNEGKFETEPGYWTLVEKPGEPQVVKELKPGQHVTFSYKAEEPGTYTFKAYQEGDHPSALLKKVKITCEKEEEPEEEKEKEEDKEEVKEEETQDQNKEKDDKAPDESTEKEKEAQPEKPKDESDMKDNKPENNEQKDKQPPTETKPADPVKPPAENKPEPPKVEQPPNNGNKSNEPKPKPPAPQPIKPPAEEKAPSNTEKSATKEDPVESKSVKDGEEE